METEADTWKRKRIEAQKRNFLKKLGSGYVLEAYIHLYIYFHTYIYIYIYIYILKYKKFFKNLGLKLYNLNL